MTPRLLTVLFVMALATPVLAHEFYLIPVYARDNNSFGSRLRITNPNSIAATVGVSQAFSFDGSRPCDAEITVAPEDSQFFMPDCGNDIMALTLESEIPVVIAHEVRLGPRSPIGLRLQSLPTAGDWLPGDRDVRIDLELESGYARANLFIVNPNPTPIDVSFRLFRHEFEGPTIDLRIPAGTLVLHVIDSFAIPIACLNVPCVPQHSMRIHASAPFYAGVSTIYGNGDAVFNSPVTLQDQRSH